MNIDCFLKRYTSLLFKEDGDAVFETLKILTNGTTSIRIAKLLNFAVSQMEGDECYVEVGTFTGGTLVSACYRTGKVCIGIDPYDKEYLWKMCAANAPTVKDAAHRNIETFCTSAKIIEKDFKEVTPEEIGHPIGVAFIDGAHMKEPVLQNLEWLHPQLADNAVIIFDDVAFVGVFQALFSWLSAHADHYELLTFVKPFFQDDKYLYGLQDRLLNQGIAILQVHKKEAGVPWVEEH
jgi:hypothetical protein